MFPLTIVTELYLGVLLGWVDISGDVRTSEDIVITRGRRNEASKVDHAKCAVKLNNRLGRYSPRNPNSAYFEVLGRNTPLRISVLLPDGTPSYRFTGEVAAWPQEWDLSGNDAWITVQVAGILRRLAHGTPPLHDALRRRIEGHNPQPLAYWPFTDGEDAVQAGEVSGQRGFTIFPDFGDWPGQTLGWRKGELAPWLDPVAQLPPNSVGDMVAPIYPKTDAAAGWSVDLFRTGSATEVTFHFVGRPDFSDLEPQVEWGLVMSGDVVQEVEITLATKGETTSSFKFVTTLVVPTLFDDGPHHVRLTVEPEAPDTRVRLHIDGEELHSSLETGAPVQPLSRIRGGFSTTDASSEDTGPASVSHIAYWGPTPPALDKTMRALHGHTGELAGRRIERLCAEQGVPLQVNGSLDETPPMGPQRVGRFLEILRTAEAVDGGVIGEARDELALSYRTRTSRYSSEGA